MIKLTGLVGLKPLHEAEGDNYTHIGYGKYKEKGKEKDSNSPTFTKDDSGKYIPTKGDKAAKGGDSSAEKAAPKVNIFDKPKSEPKKQEPSKTDDRWGDRFGLGAPAVYTDSNGKEYSGEVVMNPSNQRVQIGGKWTTIGKGSTKGIQVYGSDEFIVPDDWNDAKSFNDATEKSSKEEPKSEPSQPKRQGNPEVNKKTTELAKEMGLTPQNFKSKKEYQDAMVGAAVSALTDSNYHSEARELVAKVLGRPELAKRPEYPSLKDPDFDQKMAKIKDFYSAGDKYTKPSDEAQDFGIKVSQEAGWSGDDALDGIAHELRQNGFKKLADTLQSVIKENKSTRLKDL